MASRFPGISAALLFLAAVTGCQPDKPVSSFYPAPSLDAPRMAVQPAPRPTLASVPPLSTLTKYAKPAAVALLPMAQLVPMAGIPTSWTPAVATRPWRFIVIHHSATTTGGAAAFDKMHRAKGWDELGYDFVIGNGTDTGNGQIEVGPRWLKQKIGAHARTPDNRFNEYGVGICLVGNFDVERPTPQQLKSLEKLVAYLMATYHISPDHVVGHGETKATDCPGKYVSIVAIRRAAVQMIAPAALVKNRTVAPGTEMLTAAARSK